jgi:hypothetical protein
MLQFGASLTDDTRRVNYDCNTFIIQATGLNVIKLFAAVTYEFSYLARVFVHDKHFLLSQMFVGKVGVYPSETPSGTPLRVGS